jgi:hypothetical protein
VAVRPPGSIAGDVGSIVEDHHCRDEQYSLGAKSVSTWLFHGEALFQYMAATTNNLTAMVQTRTVGRDGI